MQILTIVGFVGDEPQLKYFGDGGAVCNFSVASSDYAGKDDPKHTTWFRVSVWGARAEAANEYLKKGSGVVVVGRLKSDENGNPRTFTRKNGEPGASYEVSATDWQFAGGKGSNVADDVEEDEEVF